MLKVLITAQPDKNAEALVEKPPTYYQAGVRGIRAQDERPATLELSFITGGPQRKRFFYGSMNFGSVAKEMMDADPEAAIKAFGAAMQQVSFPKPQEATRTAQVAPQTANAGS